MNAFDTTRFLLQRGLALIYLLGFINIINQYLPLLGSRGLLPIKNFIHRVPFKYAPSLFYSKHSDQFIQKIGWIGVALSLFAFSGLSEVGGLYLSITVWFILWALYLSFVNVGQTFYGFGWESMMLEAGFLAIFLGSADVEAPALIIWLYRWMLFRVMFGAGLIKLRGDRCWLDLSALDYHYETQPIPNPCSYYLHHSPKWLNRLGVLFTHFVELVVPFFYFIPGLLGYIGGGLTAFFQLFLMVSGNLSWLNLLTLVLCIPCFDDTVFPAFLPKTEPLVLHKAMSGALFLFICVLSIRPTLNLFSPTQMMNASFDSLHLVNTYGAFGSISKTRYEVVIAGSEDGKTWKEYEFRSKPGDPLKRPCFLAPYHRRLDWLMWFAAMGEHFRYPWFATLMEKILEGDKEVLALLKENPFESAPPKRIRAHLYYYRFSEKEEPGWWHREFVRVYFPESSLRTPYFK